MGGLLSGERASPLSFFSSHIILYPLATPCPATVSRGGGRQILRAVSPLFACPKCCRKAKCDGSRSLRPPHWINTRPTRYENVSNCRSSDFPIHPSSKSVSTKSTPMKFFKRRKWRISLHPLFTLSSWDDSRSGIKGVRREEGKKEGERGV